LNSIKFAPRYDGDFFPFTLSQLYVNAPPKSKIIGVTDMEGGIYGRKSELKRRLDNLQIYFQPIQPT
jgi:hypothetical protein